MRNELRIMLCAFAYGFHQMQPTFDFEPPKDRAVTDKEKIYGYLLVNYDMVRNFTYCCLVLFGYCIDQVELKRQVRIFGSLLVVLELVYIGVFSSISTPDGVNPFNISFLAAILIAFYICAFKIFKSMFWEDADVQQQAPRVGRGQRNQ